MKRVLRYLDFIALRLLPTIVLLFVLYSSVLNSLQAFNRIENYSIRLFLQVFLQENSMMSCFGFLGFAAMFRTFKRTGKISVLSRYCAGATALIHITLYAYAEIQSNLLHPLERTVSFTNGFINYYVLALAKNALYGIGLLLLTVNCILKDRFMKTKWILTILCALAILAASWCLPLYTITHYDDTASFRFLLNAFLLSYCLCAVIITGLYPTKTSRKPVTEDTNEEKRPV